MFGSIVAAPTDKTSEKNAVEDRPPSNPTDPMDPWNDSSLIQFWQQATESYKLHHTGTPKTQPSNDPLSERKKRSESTIQDGQTPSKKRKKLDYTNKAALTTESSTTIVSTSSSTENTIHQTNTQQETDGNKGLERVDDIVQNNESETVDAQNENEYEYDPADESENVDANKENEYAYDPADSEEAHQGYDYDHDPDKENQDYQGYYDYDEPHDYDYAHDYQEYPQYYQYYQHQHQHQHQHHQSQSVPAPPPPPTMPGLQGNEALSNMIMAWYYSGYYTGLYQAQQR